jgi:ketopantoate reductase
MDKLIKYRNLVQQLIEQYASYRPAYGDIEVETIFDTQHDHYQLVNVGWDDEQRIHGCVLHIDIKVGKIWIQHNGTENLMAKELVALGVPKQDIVLGFQSPYKRQMTEFASG